MTLIRHFCLTIIIICTWFIINCLILCDFSFLHFFFLACFEYQFFSSSFYEQKSNTNLDSFLWRLNRKRAKKKTSWYELNSHKTVDEHERGQGQFESIVFNIFFFLRAEKKNINGWTKEEKLIKFLFFFL